MGLLTRFTETSRAAGRLLLNAVLPPQCLACSAVVDTPGHLCGTCFGRFTFITPPHCGICGLPLDQTITDDLICGACVVERPAYGQARAAFIYDAHSRPLVLKLKHGDRTDMAVHLARWLQRSGREVLGTADVLVPVPLHRWRLLMRAYNQSALLAHAVGKLSGKAVAADVLIRTKSTPPQGGLSRKERRRNVAKAFGVRDAARIENKRVLLIDDVLTSGATANACALTLMQAGAAAVDVLALARVPNPADAL
ncbi:MAG: ComF family protein [Proteobacteria bacterium]|nr:ComF family protein [Pseudomonadota bacterium]